VPPGMGIVLHWLLVALCPAFGLHWAQAGKVSSAKAGYCLLTVSAVQSVNPRATVSRVLRSIHFTQAMMRPCYSAILNHAAGGKPAIVFVPTRKHVRLTALDLLTSAAADGDQHR
jgi:hypothetical protein